MPLIPALVLADTQCVALGGLVYDDWTKTEAGGSGKLPEGEKSSGYVRCATCHGWDRLGAEGAFVRRARSATRPNAGAGDGDTRSRNIDTGSFGKHAPITAAMILHTGLGRKITDGSGSWVELNNTGNAENIAAHQRGYTLGNQHPDYTGFLTERQLSCLVEFLNTPETQPDKFFKRILPNSKPVAFQLVESADAAAGKQYYDNQCVRCHEQPDNNQSKTIAGKPAGGFVEYLKSDGRFSEFAQRVLSGLPNTDMARREYGNPTPQDVVNVMKYLQDFGHFPTQDKCGNTSPSLTLDAKLHIPKVKVSLPNGDVNGWATLRYAPELARNGNPVFELTDVNNSSGRCQE